MRRRLPLVVACLSLLLCLATAWLWINSYSWSRHVGYGQTQFQSVRGMMGLKVTDAPPVGFFAGTDWAETDSEFDQADRFLGFAVETVQYGGARMSNVFVVTVPHWIIVLLFLLAAGFTLLWYRRRIRKSRHTCSGCGYDLTGNRTGQCPECGSPCVVQA